MSGVMTPRGPEPPSVYWWRRVALVLVVLTVLAGLWWLVAGRSSSGVAAPPSATSSPSGAPAASATPDASTTPVSAPDPKNLCPDTSIGVSATTDSSTYPVGASPRLTLTIQNIGSFACTRDIGPKANSLSITSGGYPVWSSDACNASNTSKLSVLEAGEKVASSITWDSRLSTKGCNKQGAIAKAGSYDLTGSNDLVQSDKTPFALTSKN
ncbi:MAG: hypothetical protein Q7L55_11130 [Actinomycetota bacterium]|nr:hypothetical protein [Actinomycetota bacterium]